jgi:hypothetical protein
VKVGIVDYFGVALWSSAQAAGEVPAPAGTFCRSNGASCDVWASGASHGEGVAEVIHEMAPAAQLYLATVTSTADLQAAVDYFDLQGVEIVSRSLTSQYDGPGDGTGPIATVINNAVANGMAWFNSAGNAAGSGFSFGQYWRGAWADTDSDSWIDFTPGDEYLGLVCGFSNGLRWSDFGSANPTDYDVYVYDNPGDPLPIFWSTNAQGPGVPPIETIGCLTAGSVDYLSIRLWNAGGGTAGDILEVMMNQSALEYWQNPYSAGGPASDSASAGMLSVGAIDPALGTTIAPYSSQGPTNDGRTKPDISAAACVYSYTYSPQCLNGTSSATPAAAGAAALVLDARLAEAPAQLKTWLLDNATVDRGAAGTDNIYGKGELILPPAPPPPTPPCGGGGAGGAGGTDAFTTSTSVTVPSLTANANPTTTTVLNAPANDYSLSSVINGTPAAAFVAPGPGSPGYDSYLYPGLGDVVGCLSSISTLGLTGYPCTSAVMPSFVLLNATVDNTDEIYAVPQAATNPGSGGTQDNQWTDNGSSTTGPGADPPWNSGWPGMDAGESTNGLPAQVDEYPGYLNTIFDPDGVAGADPFAGAQPVQPLARYAGAANVAGTTVTLNLVIFAPDVLANAGFGANHPFTATSDLGYTTVVVFSNPTVPAAHGSISDSCSPLVWAAVMNGIARVNRCAGVAGPPNCDTPSEISNPAAGANTMARYSNPRYNGAQSWVSQHQSLRDLDGDGVENSLDACALNADTYNPRTGLPTSEDDDLDGLPDVCDPNDIDGNFDADGDGWENSYDNCPNNANPTQFDNEQAVAYGTTAPSGGPRGDDIGDPCDPNDTVSNGPFATTWSMDTFTITGGTTTVDSDADGFSDFAEWNIGTDWNRRCGPGAVPALSDAWPLDFVSGGIFGSTDRVFIDDLTTFLSPRRLDTNPGDPNYNVRWDLDPGMGIFTTVINIADLNAMLGGPTAFPKMFNSNRALIGPACTGT